MQEMEHSIRNCDEMRAADCKIWRKAPKGDFRHADAGLSSPASSDVVILCGV